MFENNVSVSLLCNALYSTKQNRQTFVTLELNEEPKAADNEKSVTDYVQHAAEHEQSAAEILSSVILGVIFKNKDKYKSVNDKIEEHRCLHAIMFFKALRFENIQCKEADDFYSCVLPFGDVSWELYLHLCYLCQWSEFFIECASALSPDIVVIVLRKIYLIGMQHKNLMLYSEGMILNTIVKKLCLLDSYIKLKQDVAHRFDFPFVLKNKNPDSGDCSSEQHNALSEKIKTIPITSSCEFESNKCVSDTHDTITAEPAENDANKESKDELMFLYRAIVDQISMAADDFDVRIELQKTLFHFLNSVLELMIFCDDHKASEIEQFGVGTRFVKENSKAFPKYVFDELNVSPKIMEVIFKDNEKFLKENGKRVQDHAFALLSWEIDPYYLMLSLRENGKLCYSDDTDKSFMNGFCEDVLSLTEPPISISVLMNIVKFNFRHYSGAASRLILNHEQWGENDVLAIFENCTYVLGSNDVLSALVEAIPSLISEETRVRCVKLLLKLLSEVSIEKYEFVLNLINKGEKKECFKLPDFDSQVQRVCRRTLTYEEARKLLLPLFIQSSQSTLEFTIDQALQQGAEGMRSVKVFRDIPSACLHHQTGNPLLRILKTQFEKSDLNMKEINDLILLVETIIEIDVEKQILSSYHDFLSCCIFPDSIEDQTQYLNFQLPCLQILLKSMENGMIKEFELTKFIASKLFLLLDQYICKCDGQGKEKVTELLASISKLNFSSQLKTHADRDAILQEFNSNNSSHITFLYLNKYLRSNIKNGCTDIRLYWTQCCILGDIDCFKEKVVPCTTEYKQLVTILVPLLAHYTEAEWYKSALLCIELCKGGNITAPNILHPLFKTVESSQLHFTLEVLTDGLGILLKKNIGGKSYMSKCYINTVTKLIKERDDVTPETLTYAACNACHLLEDKLELDTLFSKFLREIKNCIIAACPDKTLQNDYVNILKFFLMQLPDNKELSIVLSTL